MASKSDDFIVNIGFNDVARGCFSFLLCRAGDDDDDVGCVIYASSSPWILSRVRCNARQLRDLMSGFKREFIDKQNIKTMDLVGDVVFIAVEISENFISQNFSD